MPDCKIIGLIFCIIFLMDISAHAQFKFDKGVLISKEDGLPANDIYSVQKGEDGFVWIGTGSGLCRFDGQQVKVYQQGKDPKYSLFDNTINGILALKNEVWVSTGQGISVLNTTTQTFRHYQLTDSGKAAVLSRKFDQSLGPLYKDRSGKIWIGTRGRGVCRYDEKKDDFHFFSFSREEYPALVPTLGTDKGILSFAESGKNDSILYAGTTGGLQEINKYTGRVRLFTFPRKTKDYQVALNAFRRLYFHDDGLLYVGSWAAGVNVFNPITNTFTPLEIKNEDGERIVNSPIGNISRKSNHEIWITGSLGLAVYDTELKEITWFKNNDLAENKFYGIDYIDATNRVWHYDFTGLQYFDPAMQQFSSYSFKDLASQEWQFAFYILSDKTGNNITVCPRMADGLYHFDKLKKKWSKTLFPKNKDFKQEKDAIHGFVQLPSGDYILSSYKQVFLFSEREKKIKDLSRYFPVSSTRWGDILLDRSGNLWLAADLLGLVKLNLKTHQYHIYKDELMRGDPGNSFGRLIRFFEDSRGNIWFERAGGFGAHIAANDSILNFIYTKNEKNSFPRAFSFAEDKKGRLWISSMDGWLGYALVDDPYKGVVYKFNLKEKGLSGFFPELATDKQGAVWGYTSEELVKMNPDDITFTKYSFRYGIDEPDFYHFSFLPSGEIIFGGRNDITLANPLEFKRNTEIPIPYISELNVLNQPFSFMNGSMLRLKHNQNFFSIGFSAVAYTMPRDVKFRYRLNGFDDWTEITGRRFANYTNVPGGNYIFQLQVANNEGAWNKNILELPIHIATPFWVTWWFRTTVVFLLVLGVYWLYRYRVSQLRKKQKMKSDYERKLANVEMSALLAQMNPHFLFNSLNSIDSYIIRNESKKASEYLNNFARLMRLILQNSRSNYISLKDELEALELYLQMESLRFKDKFSYALDVDEELDTNSIVIPPMLIQPYVENAIWHGLMHKANGEKGKVELKLYKNEDNLLCIIRDNGIGRKKAAELKGQKLNIHKRSMGMQITEDRIEIINKLYNINASVHIYDMENEQGEPKGTRVELIIPV